jgi:hypothetical protein
VVAELHNAASDLATTAAEAEFQNCSIVVLHPALVGRTPKTKVVL